MYFHQICNTIYYILHPYLLGILGVFSKAYPTSWPSERLHRRCRFIEQYNEIDCRG